MTEFEEYHDTVLPNSVDLWLPILIAILIVVTALVSPFTALLLLIVATVHVYYNSRSLEIHKSYWLLTLLTGPVGLLAYAYVIFKQRASSYRNTDTVSQQKIQPKWKSAFDNLVLTLLKNSDHHGISVLRKDDTSTDIEAYGRSNNRIVVRCMHQSHAEIISPDQVADFSDTVNKMRSTKQVEGVLVTRGHFMPECYAKKSEYVWLVDGTGFQKLAREYDPHRPVTHENSKTSYLATMQTTHQHSHETQNTRRLNPDAVLGAPAVQSNKWGAIVVLVLIVFIVLILAGGVAVVHLQLGNNDVYAFALSGGSLTAVLVVAFVVFMAWSLTSGGRPKPPLAPMFAELLEAWGCTSINIDRYSSTLSIIDCVSKDGGTILARCEARNMSRPITSKDVKQFEQTLYDQGVSIGFYITNASFEPDCEESDTLELIDGEKFLEIAYDASKT